MGGVHDTSIGIADTDGVTRWSHVGDGGSNCRKITVLPVSAMVAGIVGGDGETMGGPSGATLIVQDGSVVTMVFNLVVLLLGSPRSQVLGVVVG